MRAFADAAASLAPATVHQALFGYHNGHHLIASSTAFEPPTLDLLSRVTDGTGAESVRGFDGYLSGYPLPDGRYALGRTWSAPEAGRPGAVWTHLVVVDTEDMGRLDSPDQLVGLLRRPREGFTMPGYTSRLQPLAKSAAEVGALRADWTSALSGLYAAEQESVWAFANAASDVEADVLRIWWWHWTALRSDLSFSLGGLGRRSLGRSEFDLLVVPASREVSVSADIGSPDWPKTSAGILVAADLAGEMPRSFGDFVRFCGAETRRRTAVGLLCETWLVADDPGPHPTVALHRIAKRICQRYPEPSAMRRLKRSLFFADDRLPAQWPPTAQLDVLLDPEVAASVRRDDARLPELLGAVSHDPTALIRAASMRPPSGRPFDKRRGPATVADEVARTARATLAEAAQPSWLGEIAAAGADLATIVLLAHPSFAPERWAREYWTLSLDARVLIDAEYVGSTAAKKRADRRAPGSDSTLGWMAAYANPAEAVGWLLAMHPEPRLLRLAFTDFARELSTCSPEVKRAFRACIKHDQVAGVLLSDGLELFDGDQSTLLTLLDPRLEEVREAGVMPWAHMFEAKVEPIAAAHLLRIVSEKVGGGATEARLAGQAFACVWEACAGEDGPVWEALDSYPAFLGHGADWDRARRVSRRFAQTLAAWSKEPGGSDSLDAVLEATAVMSERAADQLRSEVRRALAPPRPAQTSAGRSRGRGSSWNPIEQARQLVDWLWRP